MGSDYESSPEEDGHAGDKPTSEVDAKADTEVAQADAPGAGEGDGEEGEGGASGAPETMEARQVRYKEMLAQL